MMPHNDNFELKSLHNYENARKHFLHFGSNPDTSIPEKERIATREKYTFPEVKHNAWLKERSAALAGSLHGLIVQQTAAQHFDADITEVQRRGIINAESDTRYDVFKDKHEQQRANEYRRKSKSIITAARGHLSKSLDALELDEALKEESAKVEERKKKAAGDDLKRLEQELAEIENFRKQLPKMREAIQEFTKQQILEALAKENLEKAAEAARLGKTKGKVGLTNEGYALTEDQKKEKKTHYIEVPIRFGTSHAMAKITINDTYDEEGRLNREFLIDSKYLKKHRLGLRPLERLNSAGRRLVISAIHEKVDEVDGEEFPLDLSELNVRTDDYESYMEFLVTSLGLSGEEADKQLAAMNNPPHTFSAKIIMHDGSIASLDEFVKKNAWEGWWLTSTGQVRAVKRKNNETGAKKTKLLVRETDNIIEEATVSDPNDKSIVAKNAALQGEQLTVAAYNKIAQALHAVDLVGHDISQAAKAEGQLLEARDSAQAVHEKAKALVHRAELELNRQLAAHRAKTPPVIMPLALTEFETIVKAAKMKLQETEVALTKIEDALKIFHDAFSATIDARVLERGLGNKNEAIQALTPLVAMHPPSVEGIAKVLAEMGFYEEFAHLLKYDWDDEPDLSDIDEFNDATNEQKIVGFKRAFDGATSAERIAMINRAYNFNSTDTIKALTAAYNTVKWDRRDPAKVAAMIGAMPVEANALIAAPAAVNVAANILAEMRNAAHAQAIVTYGNVGGVAGASTRAAVNVLSRVGDEANAARVLLHDNAGQNFLARPDNILTLLRASAASRNDLADNNDSMVTVLKASAAARHRITTNPQIRALVAGTPDRARIASRVLERGGFESSAAVVLGANNAGLAVIANNERRFLAALRTSDTAQSSIARSNSFVALMRLSESARRLFALDPAGFRALMRASVSGRRQIVNEVARRRPRAVATMIVNDHLDLAHDIIVSSPPRSTGAAIRALLAGHIPLPNRTIERICNTNDIFNRLIVRFPPPAPVNENDQEQEMSVIINPLSPVFAGDRNEELQRIWRDHPEEMLRVLTTEESRELLGDFFAPGAGVEHNHQITLVEAALSQSDGEAIQAVEEDIHDAIVMNFLNNATDAEIDLLDNAAKLVSVTAAFEEVPAPPNPNPVAVAMQAPQFSLLCEEAIDEMLNDDTVNDRDIYYMTQAQDRLNSLGAVFVAGNAEATDIVIQVRNIDNANREDFLGTALVASIGFHNAAMDVPPGNALNAIANDAHLNEITRAIFRDNVEGVLAVQDVRNFDQPMGAGVATLRDAVEVTFTDPLNTDEATTIINGDTVMNIAGIPAARLQNAVQVALTPPNDVVTIQNLKRTPEGSLLLDGALTHSLVATNGAAIANVQNGAPPAAQTRTDLLAASIQAPDPDGVSRGTSFGAVVDQDVRQEVFTTLVGNNDPDVQAFIQRMIFSADPVAITANASINALALVVAGNDAIRSSLAEILADAHQVAPEPPPRPANRLAAVKAAQNEIKANPAAALRRGLFHNPAAGLLILNQANEVINHPKVSFKETAELICAVPAAFEMLVNEKREEFVRIIYTMPDPSEEILSIRAMIIGLLIGVVGNPQADALLGVPNNYPAILTTAIHRLSQPLNTAVSPISFGPNVPLAVSQNVNRAGLTFTNVAPDGDCFFSAIAISETGLALNPGALVAAKNHLRGLVYNELTGPHMADYRDSYTAMVIQAQNEGRDDYDGLTFEAYAAGMRDGRGPTTTWWADNLAIGALANALGRPIHIISEDGTFRSSATEHLRGQPLFVFYNGRNHYDAFVREPGVSESEILARLKLTQAMQNSVANVIQNNPADQTGDNVRAIIDHTRTIANPASVRETFMRDSLLGASLENSAAQCDRKIKEVKKGVEVNTSAMSISEAEKSADVAFAMVDPAAAMAARKIMIGALTRVVSASRGNAETENAALTLIATTDAGVWAKLVFEDHNAERRRAIALTVPSPPATGATEAERVASVFELFKNFEKTKEVLKSALDETNPNRTNACFAIRDVILAIDPPTRRQDVVRIAFDAESDPAAGLTTMRAAHSARTNAAITAEVNAPTLSEKEVRDIAKVDLRACAIILNSTVAIPATNQDAVIARIAKWVPNPPAGGADVNERLQEAVRQLRAGGNDAQAALRAALAAHPVEAQEAINAAIDGASLAPVLARVKDVIITHPFATIDAHPLVKAARDKFVAHVPEVMAATFELNQALASSGPGRDAQVIEKRNALETASIAAANRPEFNVDPDVLKARHTVMYGAQLSDVQSKLHAQLLEDPSVIEFDERIGVVTFQSITLSAEDARDVINQLLQGYETYFDKINGAHAALQHNADATLQATENSGLGEGAQDRVVAAKDSLKKIEALPGNVTDNIRRAKALYHEMRRAHSSLERLFNASEVEKAEKEITVAKKELDTDKTGEAREKADFITRTRTPTINNEIPADLITADVINGVVGMPTTGTSIQTARAQDYNNLIRSLLAQMEIQVAKVHVFSDKKKVQDARMFHLREIATAGAYPNLYALLHGAEKVRAEDALNILRLIAAGEVHDGQQTYASLNQAQARALLTTIDNRPQVIQAINETLDDEPHAKQAWEKAYKDSPVFKTRTERLKEFEDKMATKTAAVTKVRKQLDTQKAQASEVKKKIDRIEAAEETAAECREKLTEKSEALLKLREEHDQSLVARAGISSARI